MALDPIIAGGYRGVEIPNALQQYAQVTGIQNAMQEQRMRALQMQQLEEEGVMRNQLRALNPEAPDYEAQLMRLNPQLGITYSKERRAAEAADVEGRQKRLDYWGSLARNAAPAPTDDALRKLASEAIKLRITSPDEANATLEAMLKMPPEERSKILFQTGAKPVTPAMPESLTLPQQLVPVGQYVFDRASREWLAPPQKETPAAAAAAPKTRAAAAPAAPAPAKPLTQAQIDARRDKLGKAFTAASSMLQTFQDVLDSVAMVKASPGLSRATGYTGVYTPSLSGGAAAQAETRMENLEGKVTALGKAAAAASGALGNMAIQEWKIVRDQIAALNRLKGTNAYLEQMALVESATKSAVERLRDAYQRTYGEDFERLPQFRDLPEPTSALAARRDKGKVTTESAFPAAAPAKPGARREIAPGVFVTERP